MDSYARADTLEPDPIGLDYELQQGDGQGEINTPENVFDREPPQGDAFGHHNMNRGPMMDELLQVDSLGETNTPWDLVDGELQQGDGLVESNRPWKTLCGELLQRDTVGESNTSENFPNDDLPQCDTPMSTNRPDNLSDSELQQDNAPDETDTPESPSDDESQALTDAMRNALGEFNKPSTPSADKPRPEANPATNDEPTTTHGVRKRRRTRLERSNHDDPNNYREGQPWTSSEDALLISLYSNANGRSWLELAETMPGRAARACSSRACRLRLPQRFGAIDLFRHKS